MERIDSRIDLTQEPYVFQTRTVIHLNRAAVTDTYELITTGKLILVERHFPHHPHGLLITDFFENFLSKIETYEK
ncbi:hypothetical protein K1F36_11280 [Muricauda sp. W52]|uniref:Uncharacterized protein n=1 Tax=Flagellimonas abyssi TaxID=2864871 RepID=A0ABS7ES58_9FLAO|nr:hypothetical protein [Allomuricauda abyssi]